MKEVFEKAIKGGWRFGSEEGQIFNHKKILIFDDVKHWFYGDYSAAFIDTNFWEALGKVEGWQIERLSKETRNAPAQWKKEMHNFVDHLIEGKNIERFFINLLKK